MKIAVSPENVRYAADVHIATQRSIRDRLAFVVWPKGRDPVLLVCIIGAGYAKKNTWIADVRGYQEFEPGPVKALAEQFAAMEEPWRAYLGDLTEAELDRRFLYTALDGHRWENAVHEILTQLHGHSLYHRGQVALLLRLIGETPPVTDYVYATRRAV